MGRTGTILTMIVSDKEFADLIGRAMDEMPERYVKHMQNIVVTYADEPNAEQRRTLHMRGDQLLLGLYEGIPLPKRGAGYNLVLPDKITLFKLPILAVTHDPASFYHQIKHTLWHEIAHYYGLDHDQIHAIERSWK